MLIFANRGMKSVMRNTRIRVKKYFAPQNEGRHHPCDHPGCTEKGEYKAPKDRHLKEYYWFCLKHVQEYNARWNYYDGQEEKQEEEPKFKRHFGGFRSKIKYQFGYDFIDELGIEGSFKDSKRTENVYFTFQDRQAAEVLGVDLEDIDLDSLKKQYKKLVKKYHPDVNAGDKDCEEKFKKISAAYKELCSKLQS